MYSIYMPQKAPLEIFQKTVQYFPTVSINLLIQNEAGEFLYVMRKHDPAKGVYWVPGGRTLAGETLKQTAERILKEEVGISMEVEHISPEYAEEIFSTEEFENIGHYTEQTQYVHYLTTACYVQIPNGTEITLDETSAEYLWAKDIPTDHPFLKKYFEMMKDYIQ